MTKRETLVANIEDEGCFGKSQLDEPVFVLCARDVLAPGVIRDWVRRARIIGVNEEKLADALDDAFCMDEWQRQHGAKTPQ